MDFKSPEANLVISIDDSEVGALLPCLLNCKFNDDLRLEFATSPILNKLIREVIEYGRAHALPSPWFAEPTPFAIDSSEVTNKHSVFNKIYNGVKELVGADNFDVVFEEAIYPYYIDGTK